MEIGDKVQVIELDGADENDTNLKIGDIGTILSNGVAEGVFNVDF